MSQKLLGVDVNRVTTTPTHELGVYFEEARGGDEGSLPGLGYDILTTRHFSPDAQYKYVRATGVGGVLKGDACIVDTAAVDEPAGVVRTLTTTAGQTIDGWAVEDIPQNSYGWIQTRGRFPFVSSAVAAQRRGVRVAAAGVVAGNVLGTTAAGTAGEVALLAAVTVGSAAGRRAIALDASADDGSTTQLRVEAYILG